jgi:hypothetical protein
MVASIIRIKSPESNFDLLLSSLNISFSNVLFPIFVTILPCIMENKTATYT